jgi:hypothetical protein
VITISFTGKKTLYFKDRGKELQWDTISIDQDHKKPQIIIVCSKATNKVIQAIYKLNQVLPFRVNQVLGLHISK